MKKFFVFVSCIAFFAMSCNKLSVEVFIEGNVYDQDGMIALGNVEVTINANGEAIKATTNSSGHYAFEKVPPGKYILTFSRSGYGTLIDEIDASVDFGDAYSANLVTVMYKFDQELNTVIVKSLGGQYKPAANVPYTIYLSNIYLNNKIEGTTNENGEVIVSNLPQQAISFEIDFEDENYRYYRGEYEYPEFFDEMYTLYKYSLSNLFYLQETNIIDDEGEAVVDFATGDNIEFTFSSPIDKENYYIYLNKSGYKDYVAIDVSFENDDRKIIINPIGSDLGTAYYNIGIEVQNLDEVSYNNNFGFSTVGIAEQITLGKVTGIDLTYPSTITNYTSYIEIEFPTVDNAQYYEVYGSYGASEYLRLTTIYDYGYDIINTSVYLDNLQDIEIPAGGLFANGAIYKLIVRATANGVAPGEFSDVFVISAGK